MSSQTICPSKTFCAHTNNTRTFRNPLPFGLFFRGNGSRLKIFEISSFLRWLFHELWKSTARVSSKWTIQVFFIVFDAHLSFFILTGVCMYRGCPSWRWPWYRACQLGLGEGPIGLSDPISQPRGTIDTASLTLDHTYTLMCAFWANFTLGS